MSAKRERELKEMAEFGGMDVLLNYVQDLEHDLSICRGALDNQTKQTASATQRLEEVRGALARLLDKVATVETDQPEADFACVACHGLDGHHRPGCAVQAGFRALAGETGTGRGTT